MIAILCGGAFALLMTAYTLLAGRVLTRRRPPDAPSSPEAYGIPYEDVRFPSRYKAMLNGWWMPAPEAQGTVIFCHGQNGSMEGDLPQAVFLHRAGYNVLMFNLRAHGSSDGEKVTYGVFEKEDLLGAVDFVYHVKAVPQVAVMGFSMGAAVAMIAAALTDKIDTLILDGAFLRFVDVVAAHLRQRHLPPFVAQGLAQLAVLGASLLTNTRMYQVSPRLWGLHLREEVATLFIHGAHDRLVEATAVQALAADVRGPKEIWLVPGSDHREAFTHHPEEYEQRVLAWLAAHHGSKNHA